ncbi:hypothetical protein PHYPSEUDO_012087 [Phytophthora pseudosyringae]|uniref:Uncharacterized protein n=1 Tax=Phytophthora pseudosyringae TaxID=221518 RepID=A0A8T1W5P9_9STRA|nr:hypothetical protein PHYPSEUDO_012087 [Phytophthora pseudosyringae]
MDSELAPRRSKREHQPSAKAAASAAVSSLPPASASVSRRSQRRRVTRSASPASTPASTRNSSPVRGAAASPASADLAPVVVRRRLRAAAHTGSNSSVTQGVLSADPGVHDGGKVLSRYSSHDCALLCEVIMSQLKKQTLAPTVLDEAKSPAFIKWEPVARKMETMHKLRMTPPECQLLWKFLAYGEIPVVETDELLPDSDEEDFHKPPKEINAQVAARRAKAEEKAEDVATDEATEKKSEQVATGGEEAAKNREPQAEKDTTSETGTKQKETQGDDTSETQDEERGPSVRLYPTYSLPTGAPDAWYRPFGPKDALPLTFVASRFLRRKANPPVQALARAAGQPSTADLKRKQAAAASNATATKKPKLATPPRVFTPSSTPPPAAKRARSELEFFELRLREEQAKKTPGAKFELSAPAIQRRFGEASAEVRHQCQVLGAHDVERFNREVVRLRIWQKAMGTSNIKPKPTLAPAIPTPVAKPAASPLHTSGAKPVSSVSAGAAVASTPKTPATTTKSAGPTAALLAHTAAVAATAAKAKATTTPTTTSASGPKTAREQKDGGAASAKRDTK